MSDAFHPNRLDLLDRSIMLCRIIQGHHLRFHFTKASSIVFKWFYSYPQTTGIFVN